MTVIPADGSWYLDLGDGCRVVIAWQLFDNGYVKPVPVTINGPCFGMLAHQHIDGVCPNDPPVEEVSRRRGTRDWKALAGVERSDGLGVANEAGA